MPTKNKIFDKILPYEAWAEFLSFFDNGNSRKLFLKFTDLYVLHSFLPKEHKIMKTELSFRIDFNPYIGSYYEDCIGFSKTDDAIY